MEKIKMSLKSFFGLKIFRILKWPLLILVALFVTLVIVRASYLASQDKIDAQVIKIHATKLTLGDVMGDNLPPDPGINVDKTIQGIDANNDGIRDDVELAIFNKYPDSAKTRAALLQYALTLQMETTQPFLDTTIATEIAREQSRGFECVGEILKRNSQTFDEDIDELIDFVEAEQFNTQARKSARNNFIENVRSFSGLERICDVDYSTLPN